MLKGIVLGWHSWCHEFDFFNFKLKLIGSLKNLAVSGLVMCIKVWLDYDLPVMMEISITKLCCWNFSYGPLQSYIIEIFHMFRSTNVEKNCVRIGTRNQFLKKLEYWIFFRSSIFSLYIYIKFRMCIIEKTQNRRVSVESIEIITIHN